MNLIKRHYEKVILLLLFVIFIGLMFFVQSIISESGEVTEKDLKLEKPVADFDNEDPADERFDTQKRWNDSQLTWRDNVTRNNSECFSDFVSAFPMSACPHCSDIARAEERTEVVLVPQNFFSDKAESVKTCPQCKKELLPAPVFTEDELRQYSSTSTDKDGDGIEDVVESNFGMDSNDRYDACYDKDGDGFSNIFEINNEYKPNDGESHPPYWWRLHLKAIRQIELPVRFMALNDNDSDDKQKWLLQFNSPDRYGRKGKDGKIITRSEFLRIGRRINIEGRQYTIDDVERRQKPATSGVEPRPDEKVDNKGMIDISRVFLTEVVKKGGGTPDKLIMVVNQPAYSSDQRPVLVDTGDISTGKHREYSLKIGDTVSLPVFPDTSNDQLMSGSRRPSVRRRVGAVYRLKSVDAEKKIIIMEEVVSKKRKTAAAESANDSVIEITPESKVPKKQWVIKKVERTESVADESGLMIDRKQNRR